jgi:hypothetical protein
LLIFRLLAVEYIKNILDILINSIALSFNENDNDSNSRLAIYVDSIKRLNPFDLIIKYFFEFEFNNIYQKLFEDIIALLINKHTPEKLLKSFFIENKFIEKFIDNTVNNYFFKFRYFIF